MSSPIQWSINTLFTNHLHKNDTLFSDKLISLFGKISGKGLEIWKKGVSLIHFYWG